MRIYRGYNEKREAWMLLTNRTAVITGCNRGIGRAILETFAENGANIFACVRKESDKFTDFVVNVAMKKSVLITPIYFDLGNVEQIKNGIKKIISTKKRIDILVNNAGMASGAFFHMTAMKDLKKIFDINFFSQILFSQGMSRYMSRFKAGSIINIASIAGVKGDAGMISYGTSKASLISATKIMAVELGEMNIRVNAIAPSITKTDMFDQMEEKVRNKIIGSSILKRPADAVEIANVALFLASHLSSYITGQVLCVDGGLNK
jgi:3-oxoacyl-[acyl-carrier protein] reductase